MKKIFFRTTSPLLIGGFVSFIFYAAIRQNWISSPLVHRYFAGHPVEYITTIMFFVGAVILASKYLATLAQRKLLRLGTVLPETDTKAEARYAPLYMTRVAEFEQKHGVSLLTDRLRKALSLVYREQSAEHLDDELRYLHDNALTKADNEYGLIRLILWAVPMLGFLGTVIGITAALDALDLNQINESSKALSAGLAVAFDTTGLAIALDVLLFFIQFVVQSEETRVLSETDRLAAEELRGRFVTVSERALVPANIPQAFMCQSDKPMQIINMLNETIKELSLLRSETTKQTQKIQEVLGTRAEVMQLEHSLKNNLAMLANTGNFEETVNSLAAAIHLLNSNRRIELKAV